MAVVTKYSRAAKDPTAINAPDAAQAEGRMRIISGAAVAVANGDSINSKHYLGKIPSHAIPMKGLSVLHHTTFTGLSDYDIGLEKDGTLVDLDVFADGLDLTSGTTKDPFASIALADVGKKVWELLGLTRDPGVEYDIIGTLKAASTAAGNISPYLVYAKK